MKKIISGIITVAMLFSCFSALALTVNKIDTDISTGTVEISIIGVEENAFLLITNPGYSDEETADKKAAIQNSSIISADEKGNSEYIFRLAEPADGEYKIYIDGTYADSFVYDLSKADDVISTIKGYAASDDKEGLKGYLAQENTLKALALENFKPLVSTEIALDMTSLYAKLISAVKEEAFEGKNLEKTAKMQKIIKTVASVELLNQNKAEGFVYNEDGSLVYDSVLELSQVDEKYDVTLYNYYINGFADGETTYVLTAEGKSLVKKALFGKNFSTTEELYKAFMEAVVCAGVNNSTIKGSTGTATYGHIKELLNADNKAATGVTGVVSNFVASKLVNTAGNINSISELNTLIAQYKAQEGQTPSGGGGGGGGGVSAPGMSSGGGMTVTPVEDVNALKQNDAAQSENMKYAYSDISDVQWAIKAIEDLSSKGIINGIGDRKFDPNGTVTREQFVKMLCVALNLTEEAEISFTDVEKDNWSVPYIKKAVKAGLISGIDENTFGFGNAITRQDISVILHRTIKDIKGTAEFTDKAEIADYAVEAVGALSGLKILNGFEDGSFRPAESCTRAQAAVIIYNYLNR